MHRISMVRSLGALAVVISACVPAFAAIGDEVEKARKTALAAGIKQANFHVHNGKVISESWDTANSGAVDASQADRLALLIAGKTKLKRKVVDPVSPTGERWATYYFQDGTKVNLAVDHGRIMTIGAWSKKHSDKDEAAGKYKKFWYGPDYIEGKETKETSVSP